MEDSDTEEGCLVLEVKDNLNVQVPGSINNYLRPYQREGVKFLYRQYSQNAGAILADDMGLGKTIQSIAFISAILGKSDAADRRETPSFLQSLDSATAVAPPCRPSPVLVICPAAVLYNWVAELGTWGRFDVGLFVGKKRSETLRSARNGTVDVVMSSFEAARDHVTALNGPNWSVVIVDEVHRLKSMTSLVTQALGRLECRRRVGLSGTVVQNDLREFWCVLDWANPGCLGTSEQFVNDFVRPIERGRRRCAVKREVAESWRRRELLTTLRQRWLLRRTKALIANQLPNKTDQIVYCPPSEFQREVYRTVLASPDVQMLLQRTKPCFCRSGRKASRCCLRRGRDSAAPSSLAFSYIALLLKISNHPYLLTPRPGAATEQQNVLARQVCRLVFERFPEFASMSRIQAFRALSDPKYCGKMKVLIALIDHFRQRSQKILIFSYSTRMLKIIRAYVSNQGYELTYIDGETAAAERPRLCAEFSRRPQWAVALVSTRAGGQGLNITGATAVVVFDPSWNPAHDLQAQDRAYRLGQARDVSVFRLVSAGTIEENIYLRQVRRQQLSPADHERQLSPADHERQVKRQQLSPLITGGSASSPATVRHAALYRRAGEAGRGGTAGWSASSPATVRHAALYRRAARGGAGRHRRLERLLTGHEQEATAALPTVQTGVAGLTVSDYTTVAPSDDEQVLTSGDEVEAPSPSETAQTRTPSTAPLDAALKSCGVQHTHGNAALVGASRVEEHVARQAARAVFVLGDGTQEPAEWCAPLRRQAGPVRPSARKRAATDARYAPIQPVSWTRCQRCLQNTAKPPTERADTAGASLFASRIDLGRALLAPGGQRAAGGRWSPLGRSDPLLGRWLRDGKVSIVQ
ncbi:DNA excision repair protein ERCC-6-like 2 [Pollicipes pollicipes]|uniref:DNA excision repair protein ERCC-6-like 2 n=1 Tax=Pollicipes pollicipes TaxID=41117 RepID=UPI001884AEA4|nr:DNA excision repair protein ERCC-6-like 2 [Pollicipes pollicipes]